MAVRMRNAARTMAALHALEPDVLGLTGEPLVGPAEEIDRWCRLLDTVDPALAPGWEAVAAALRACEPPALSGAVVHGDFRLGNTLAAGARIAAVVDWEIWSVGDPRVDVGWYLANADPGTYRRSTRYVDSLPAPAELAEIYFGACGHDVPDLEWFQALACFKSTATWSLIVKHNRRRAAPDPAMEEMAAALPNLLERGRERSFTRAPSQKYRNSGSVVKSLRPGPRAPHGCFRGARPRVGPRATACFGFLRRL